MLNTNQAKKGNLIPVVWTLNIGTKFILQSSSQLVNLTLFSLILSPKKSSQARRPNVSTKSIKRDKE